MAVVRRFVLTTMDNFTARMIDMASDDTTATGEFMGSPSARLAMQVRHARQ